MNDSEFPLCRSVGLVPYGAPPSVISASMVEQLLSKGVRCVGDSRLGIFSTQDTKVMSLTHSALLIDINPIVRERRRELSESQVREALSGFGLGGVGTDFKGQIIERLFGDRKEES